MRIQKVELENWCQHKGRVDDLCSGLVGIVGPNGSGKSNYVKGILFALTGASGNYGKKEEDLSWGETTGFTKIAFSSGGHEGTLKRWIRVAKCQMEFAGVEYRTATVVEEAMSRVLGLNFQVLSDMIFVPQGKMESLLFVRPAERAKSFQLLFGTAKAENIRSALQMELVKLESLTKAEGKSLEELHISLESQLKEGKDAEKARKNAEKRLPSQVDRLKAQETCTSYEGYPARKKQVDSLRELLGRTSKDALEERQRILAIKSELAQKEKGILDFQADYLKAKEVVDLAEEHRRTEELRAYFQASIDKAQAGMSEPKPAVFTRDEELARKEEQLYEQKALVAAAQKVVAAFRGGEDEPVCPTCNQPVSVEFIQAQRDIFESFSITVPGLQQECDVLRQQKKVLGDAFLRWEQRTAAHKKEHQSLLAQLAGITPSQLIADVEVIKMSREVMALYNAAAAEIVSKKQNLAIMEPHLARLSEGMSDSRRRLEAAERNLGEEVKDEAYQKAKELLADYDEVSRQIQNLSGQIESYQRNVAALQQRIADITAVQKNTLKYKEWQSLCDRTRELFHRDNLPNRVAGSFLGAINARLSKYLELFGVPYAVKINDALEIVCSFGSTEVPAERLSGGQKVELSLAFRFSIYDLFSRDLGLLVLDEPTAYLDNDRIDSVAKLMTNVRSYSRSAGLQVIVVTHENRLAEICDLVVRLG